MSETGPTLNEVWTRPMVTTKTYKIGVKSGFGRYDLVHDVVSDLLFVFDKRIEASDPSEQTFVVTVLQKQTSTIC